jgi:3-polyprenyl-4-hydroxybenzoate decarboxylase
VQKPSGVLHTLKVARVYLRSRDAIYLQLVVSSKRHVTPTGGAQLNTIYAPVVKLRMEHVFMPLKVARVYS